jgi:hypothetical protein
MRIRIDVFAGFAGAAVIGGTVLGMSSFEPAFADPTYLTCHRADGMAPQDGLLLTVDYGAGAVTLASLRDQVPLRDAHGHTAISIRVDQTRIYWHRDVNAGEVRKVFYELDRLSGKLSFSAADQNGVVLTSGGENTAIYNCAAGAKPRVPKPKF